MHNRTFSWAIPALLFASICLAGTLSAQSLTLKGQIKDAETKAYVPFVTVTICGKPIGVVTNEQGEFELFIAEYGLDDALCISSIGYAKFQMGVEDWGEEVREVFLRPETYVLDDVLITDKKKRSLSAIKIIRQAVKNIKENYPMEPFKLKGYYRDYQKEEGHYVNLLESALEIYDPGFQAEDYTKSQFRLLQLNEGNEFPKSPPLLGAYGLQNKKIVGGMMGYQGQNEFALLRFHDPIRNFNQRTFSFVHTFNKDFIPSHRFTLLGIQVLGDDNLYEIGFENKSKLKTSAAYPGNTYHANGKIYIHTKTFAIMRLEYLMEMNGNDYEGKMFEVNVSYRPFEGKMYLNYLSFSNYFETNEVPEKALFRFDLFRVVDDPDVVELQFSDPINVETATVKDAYGVYKGGSSCKIENIEIIGDRTVRLRFVDNNAEGNLQVSANGVKDYTGASIGDIIMPELVISHGVVQFREFFVSEIIPQGVGAIGDTELLEKIYPLRDLPRKEDPNFWKRFNKVNLAPLQE